MTKQHSFHKNAVVML